MNVRELIARLQQVDLDLPVCLADWQEQCSSPAEVTIAEEAEGHYHAAGGREEKLGRCVVLDAED